MGHKFLAFRFLHPLSILSLLSSVFASPDYFLPDSPYSAWVFLINHIVLPPGLNCFCPSCSCQGTNRPHLSHPLFCPRQHHLMGHPKPQGLEPHMLSPSKPSDTSSGQGSPIGLLSAENALWDTWHQGHSATWPLLCVHAQSLVPVSSQHSNARRWEPVVRVLGLHACQLPPSGWWCCAVGLISQEDRGTYFLYKVWNESVDIPLRLWLCMFMAFICSSSVFSSGLGLHLAECVWAEYFPQATHCHFCAWIKHQLLALFNAGFFPFAIFCCFHCFLIFLQFC